MSSIVIAIALAPAVAPLWATGVAIAMASVQLWPGRPGIFDGKRSVTVGTVQVTSPMSSEPPPRFRSSGPGSSRPRAVVSSPLIFGFLSSVWSALAKRWSSSVHLGIPTCLMLAAIASAIGLLKYWAQALPSRRSGSSVVPVIIAAPCAIESPTAQRYLVLG